MGRKRINEMVKQLKEGVNIDTIEYSKATNGRQPKGRGKWVFTVNKPDTEGDIDYGNDQEVFVFNGIYPQAKNKAIQWVKTLRSRPDTVYVLG